jgi:hypothetical protein
MSFEGYFKKFCAADHYEEQDVYMETDKCPCGEKWVREELVDTTNGEPFESVFNKDIDLDPDDTALQELNKALEELQNAYTSEMLLNSEMAERNAELENKIDKLTTTLVSYEATIGHLKDALIQIAEDYSPPWDKTDFQRIAKEALKGIRK